MSSPQRILIVRLSAIGDVIHTIPALERLRAIFPQASIGWVVEDFASAYLQGHPALDVMHVIPKKHWRGAFLRHFGPEIRPFVADLRARRYDFAIDFQGLTKSGIWAWLSGAPVRVGFGDSQGRELNKAFTNRKVNPPPEALHVIERNLALLQAISSTAPNSGPPPLPAFRFTTEEEQAADGILDGSNSVIGLNVGAGWATKRWPAEHWAELARLLSAALPSCPLLLLWGNDLERQLAAKVASLAKMPETALRISPPTSLRVAGALIRRLEAYVGLDTGATHLAAALGLPTVSIHGASSAERNGPYWPGSRVLQASTERCIPCWKRQCALPRQLACLWDVTPPEVLRNVLEVREIHRTAFDRA